MYLLLHRARRNAGDALIFERGRRLIEAFRPGIPITVAEGWRPLRDQLPDATLRAVRAVVVVGGPGYGNGLPGRYPLGLDAQHDPPLIFLALGSAVTPGTPRQLERFRFDRPSHDFLASIAARSHALGARDELTARMLAANGFERVLMTGDPAWYDLDHIDRTVHTPTRIARLAFTPPANPIYFDQAVRLAHAIADRFPAAATTVVHHRGIQRPFSAVARSLRWAEADITGSADGFAVFDSVDVHIGYRLHAHLYALSHGRPSYLVTEDSRGTGMSLTLGQLGVPGFDERADGPLHRLAMQHLPRLANAYRSPTQRLGRPISMAFRMPDIAASLLDQVAADLASGFPRHVAAREVVRSTLPTMRSMIEHLP